MQTADRGNCEAGTLYRRYSPYVQQYLIYAAIGCVAPSRFRKTDDWLVQTVGVLIGVLSSGLLITGVRDAPSRNLSAVAAGSAAAPTAIEVIYVARGRISEVYLLDAAAKSVLIAGWTITLNK